MIKTRGFDSVEKWSLWLSSLTLVIAALALSNPAHAGQGHQGPVLGVGVEALDFAELDKLGISHGVRVVDVQSNSPADRAGIKAGDVVSALDGKAVFSPSRLQWLAAQARSKKDVTLSLHRDGATSEVSVDLTAKAVEESAKRTVAGRGFIGIRMQPMNAAMREAFGSPDDIGVLVADIVSGSPAEKAGLAAGDVIVGLAGKTVDEISDIHRALNYFEPEESISLDIYRDKQEKPVKLTLGAAQAPGYGYGMHHPGYAPGFGHPHMPHHFQHHMEGIDGKPCPMKAPTEDHHST